MIADGVKPGQSRFDIDRLCAGLNARRGGAKR
jgi:hypothetical protein